MVTFAYGNYLVSFANRQWHLVFPTVRPRVSLASQSHCMSNHSIHCLSHMSACHNLVPSPESLQCHMIERARCAQMIKDYETFKFFSFLLSPSIFFFAIRGCTSVLPLIYIGLLSFIFKLL